MEDYIEVESEIAVSFPETIGQSEMKRDFELIGTPTRKAPPAPRNLDWSEYLESGSDVVEERSFKVPAPVNLDWRAYDGNGVKKYANSYTIPLTLSNGMPNEENGYCLFLKNCAKETGMFGSFNELIRKFDKSWKMLPNEEKNKWKNHARPGWNFRESSKVGVKRRTSSDDDDGSAQIKRRNYT